MRKTLPRLAAIGALCGVAGWLAHALADGVPPTPGSIYYSGEITNVSGTPFVATTANLHVRLYDGASGSTMYCDVFAPATPIASGHFRVALDPPGYRTCLDALRAHPTVWVEVQVETETMPREQIGAVPYALEAARVTRSGPTGAASAASTFCSYTSATTTGRIVSGSLVGWPAARDLCVRECGSSTAHMCSIAEMGVAAQLGLVSPGASDISAWATGNRWWVDDPSGTTGDWVVDCYGWTSANHLYGPGSGLMGNLFHVRTSGALHPDYTYCDAALPIACCD